MVFGKKWSLEKKLEKNGLWKKMVIAGHYGLEGKAKNLAFFVPIAKKIARE
jgi:hypothetical protein